MNSTRKLPVRLTLSLCVLFVFGQPSNSAFGATADAARGGYSVNLNDVAYGGDKVDSDATAHSVASRAGGLLIAEGAPTTSESSSTMPLPRGPNGELPAVLDPDKYSGQAKAGYAACKEVPQICDKLFCYCGCDLTDCHGSLLDCFTNDHGEDCHICQEEAIIALKLHKKGKTLSEIQKEIDKKFEKEYPFEVESPALQKYKANRLWDMGKKKAPTGKLGTVQNGAGDPGDPAAPIDPSSPKRKLKPDGSCCAGKEK